MLRRLLVALAITLALAAAEMWGSQAAHAEMWGSQVYITNHSTSVTDAQVLDALPAFQAATSEDFAPYWHEDAELVYLAEAGPPAGGWTIDLVDSPECWRCEGFHDITATGVPYAQVGTEDVGDWQIVFTHELFEVLGNPYGANPGALAVRVGRLWYLRESADPVEADKFAYTRPGASGTPVRISDFVTLAWFRRKSAGPWDFTGHVKRPLQILADGYQLIWRSGAWTSLP